MPTMGIGPKFLIISGIILISAGVFWYFFQGQIPLGKLPGDIHLKTKNGNFYFPITSCILISILLSIIGYFFKD